MDWGLRDWLLRLARRDGRRGIWLSSRRRGRGRRRRRCRLRRRGRRDWLTTDWGWRACLRLRRNVVASALGASADPCLIRPEVVELALQLDDAVLRSQSEGGRDLGTD
jgi:hypothetical protein